jgi:phosphocarrier protein
VKGGKAVKEIIVTIQGESGLHARPAGLLAAEAQKYQSEIVIEKDSRSINAKSIMSVLSLGGTKGDQVTVRINGEDEAEAAVNIELLFENVLANA